MKNLFFQKPSSLQFIISFVVLFFAISFTNTTVAQIHDNCNGCHIFHNAIGGTLTGVNGNANLCISCHNPVGSASPKPFTNSMKSIPGVSGTSHSWDEPSVNATYETNITTNSEMLLRLPGDSIICSTCHNQHGSGIQPNFLRVDNTGDNLCKDCHSARDVLRFSDVPSGKGSHPVGIVYNGALSKLNATPTDSVLLLGSSSDSLQCSSCHNLHRAPFDNGYILRAENTTTLCTKCHTYGPHNSMDCKVCHQTHNSNKSNIYMIKDIIATPNSGNKTVVYTAQTGAGSFADDGVAPYDGICEVCHTTTVYHRNDASGDHAHNTGTNCTGCHTHANAFGAGACDACHNTTQGTRRQIFAAGGDYDGTSISHHVGAAITNDDCVICHDMSAHKAGTVKLIDDLATIYDYNPAAPNGVNNFCINCHDADGYGGDNTPFTDALTVPDVKDGTIWSNAAHNTAGLGCLGNGSSTGCHGTGHTSLKNNLLSPAGSGPGVDNVDEEEGLCFACHDAGGPALTDISSEFGLTHKHEVNDGATTSGLECISCHNPHKNNSTNLLSDPYNNSALWIGNNRDFCIDCHDGNALPTGISFPAGTFTRTGSDKSGYVGTSHDVGSGTASGLGAQGCMHCHEQHGSNVEALLKDTYLMTDGTGYSAANFNLCWTCHEEPTVLGQNAWGQCNGDMWHNGHFGESIACYFCHDVHQPNTLGEAGLIRLDNAINAGWMTGSDAFVPGACGNFTCHGTTHDGSGDWVYSRLTMDTTPDAKCITCHSGGRP